MLAEVLALSWVDWVVTFTGIIYVILAAREQVSCWYWGMISCSFWAYADFSFYRLYADGVLQVFYALMSLWGLWQWKYGQKDQQELAISRMTRQEHLWVWGIGLLGGLLAGYFLGAYTNAAATYPDAITTVFAILTTILLIQKKLENWLYWLLIDFTYLFIYGSRGAYLFVLIMVIYLIVAVLGYKHWKERYVIAMT